MATWKRHRVFISWPKCPILTLSLTILFNSIFKIFNQLTSNQDNESKWFWKIRRQIKLIFPITRNTFHIYTSKNSYNYHFCSLVELVSEKSEYSGRFKYVGQLINTAEGVLCVVILIFGTFKHLYRSLINHCLDKYSQMSSTDRWISLSQEDLLESKIFNFTKFPSRLHILIKDLSMIYIFKYTFRSGN